MSHSSNADVTADVLSSGALAMARGLEGERPADAVDALDRQPAAVVAAMPPDIAARLLSGMSADRAAARCQAIWTQRRGVRSRRCWPIRRATPARS